MGWQDSYLVSLVPSVKFQELCNNNTPCLLKVSLHLILSLPLWSRCSHYCFLLLRKLGWWRTICPRLLVNGKTIRPRQPGSQRPHLSPVACPSAQVSNRWVKRERKNGPAKGPMDIKDSRGVQAVYVDTLKELDMGSKAAGESLVTLRWTSPSWAIG